MAKTPTQANPGASGGGAAQTLGKAEEQAREAYHGGGRAPGGGDPPGRKDPQESGDPGDPDGVVPQR